MLNDTHALLVSLMRLGRGWYVRSEPSQPTQLLEMYEFEACPFCRKVREVLSELDLEYVSRTVARGSAGRDVLRARGGKMMVPYLIDPNTGTEMYESEDIIDYLHERYGGRPRSRAWRLLSPLNTAGATLASAVRPKGRRVGVERDKQPEQLLELYGFEASPYCRKVREALSELDLHYRARNVAKGSVRRAALVERGGKMMVPYLIDPNTGTEMYESDDIVRHLHETYG
jgi:glutathione S-transferase